MGREAHPAPAPTGRHCGMIRTMNLGLAVTQPRMKPIRRQPGPFRRLRDRRLIRHSPRKRTRKLTILSMMKMPYRTRAATTWTETAAVTVIPAGNLATRLPQPGGYGGGWWNPMNWQRGVYTGDPNVPDEYYNAAMEPAGQVYNERKGAAHGVLSAASGVPGVGMLPGGVNAVLYEAEGEHGKAAMAAGEGAGRWDIRLVRQGAKGQTARRCRAGLRQDDEGQPDGCQG